jgi:CheY-like chemotaxis protein
MKGRILFVEDENAGVEPYFIRLRREGFECILTMNGDQAIRELKRERFDLIVLDIMFPPGNSLGTNIDPKKSGLELLNLIRENRIDNCNPDIKIIVLTAVISDETEQKIRKLGVHAYLKKPIAYSEVMEIFKTL